MEDKMQRMSYSCYKKYYSSCKTVLGSYDAKTKTICAIVPKQARIPKAWKAGDLFGGTYKTPCGVNVYVYNTGAEKNFLVEANGWSNSRRISKTIAPGPDCMARLFAAVKELEKEVVKR